MKGVGAALGDQRDLPAAGVARISIGVGGGHPEFLHRVGRRIQDTGKSVTIILVVDPYAVQGDIRLVAAHAIHRAAPRVRRLIRLGGSRQIRYSRLQAQEINHVAVGNGQLRDLVFFDRVAERRVGAIDERSLPFDRYQFRYARNLKPNEYGGGRADRECDLRRHKLCKPGCRCLQLICTRRHIQELVEPCPVAGGTPLQSRCCVGQSDRRVGNARARRIRHAAIQLAG